MTYRERNSHDAVTDQPRVAECTVAGCAYNHDGCHAVAVTIGSHDSDCSTFFPTSQSGGLDKVIATVGACQRTECVHNEHAVCTANSVRVGPGAGTANCLTYQHG